MHQPYPPPSPARPPRWGRFAAWTVALAAAAFAVGLGVAALTKNDGGQPTANPTVCKAELAANYRRTMANPGGPTASAPPACLGLDEATLERLVGEVVNEYLGSDQAKRDWERIFEEALASATASP